MSPVPCGRPSTQTAAGLFGVHPLLPAEPTPTKAQWGGANAPPPVPRPRPLHGTGRCCHGGGAPPTNCCRSSRTPPVPLAFPWASQTAPALPIPPPLSHCSSPPHTAPAQGSIRKGGGVWNPKVCVPKIAKSIFPFVNFIFSHYEIWAKGGGTTPLCDIPFGYCFFTGPWTVTRSSIRMLRRVATFCRPLQPVLLLGSLPRLRSPVVGVLGLLVSFPRSWSPVIGALWLCWSCRK